MTLKEWLALSPSIEELTGLRDTASANASMWQSQAQFFAMLISMKPALSVEAPPAPAPPKKGRKPKCWGNENDWDPEYEECRSCLHESECAKQVAAKLAP